MFTNRTDINSTEQFANGTWEAQPRNDTMIEGHEVGSGGEERSGEEEVNAADDDAPSESLPQSEEEEEEEDASEKRQV